MRSANQVKMHDGARKTVDSGERSLLEHVLGYFGFVRVTELPPIGEHAPGDAEIAQTLGLHRKAKDGFDYELAKTTGPLLYYHVDRDGETIYHHAVGKDDWMPLAIVAMSLGGGTGAALQEIAGYLQGFAWLRVGHPVFESWVAANRQSFDLVQSIGNEFPTVWCDAASQDLADMFATAHPREVSYQFQIAWKRMYAGDSAGFLAISEGHHALVKAPEYKHVDAAVTTLLSLLHSLAATWLEVRGWKVDRELALVKVPGYEALFAIDSWGY